MPKGQYIHKKTIPTCHPERKHVALGLCEQCYRNGDNRNWKRNLRSYDPTITGKEMEYWINQKKTSPCEICGGRENLMFDHDHETKKMRGILCNACNSLLGHSDDLPDRLLEARNYLHRKLPRPKMVVIIWNDAQDSLEPWVGEAEAKQFAETPCPIVSYGFLVRKTKNYVVIAGDWNDSNKDYGRVTKIPTKMITSMKELQE